MKIFTPNFFAISFVNISKSLTIRAVFNRMFKCDNRGRPSKINRIDCRLSDQILHLHHSLLLELVF